MIFDLLAPPQGPRGRGQKKMCRCTPHSCEQHTHTKFGWISSNGLGGDSVTDRRTDGRTDRRTDRRTDGRTEAIAISPTLFKNFLAPQPPQYPQVPTLGMTQAPE